MSDDASSKFDGPDISGLFAVIGILLFYCLANFWIDEHGIINTIMAFILWVYVIIFSSFSIIGKIYRVVKLKTYRTPSQYMRLLGAFVMFMWPLAFWVSTKS